MGAPPTACLSACLSSPEKYSAWTTAPSTATTSAAATSSATLLQTALPSFLLSNNLPTPTTPPTHKSSPQTQQELLSNLAAYVVWTLWHQKSTTTSTSTSCSSSSSPSPSLSPSPTPSLAEQWDNPWSDFSRFRLFCTHIQSLISTKLPPQLILLALKYVQLLCSKLDTIITTRTTRLLIYHNHQQLTTTPGCSHYMHHLQHAYDPLQQLR
ncbi:hypothetical protein HK102_004638, partial [Quaeritorhiza haematococci]